MKIAIHQPYYLPWPGYFHKMSVVDKFVILDEAQYTRGEHFNRTRILVKGKPAWLTVPIKFEKDMQILQIKVEDRKWIKKHAETIRQSYAKSSWTEFVRSLAVADLERGVGVWRLPITLIEIDIYLLEILRRGCLIDTPMVFSSTIDFEPSFRTERLVNICKALGADTYVSGTGGSRGYLDLEMFKEAGIRVEWQSFKWEPYEQAGAEEFVAGLSVVDTLAAMGPVETRKYIDRCGRLEEAI